MSFILGKEPKLVWKHFDEIRKIPRCSKNEEMIRNYVVEFAKANDLDHEVDDAGNVVVRKPASKGMAKRPTVVLQGHLDMVCEKNSNKVHDFTKDAIELVEDGDWLKADGTTLGADNGIGVAMSLAVLEDDTMKHGPIEALFTVDEETGLTGAFAMDKDLVKGRIMLNLDSEEMGAIFIGCAGGGDSVLTMPLKTKAPPKDYVAVTLKVGGLKGGHSGVDIHEQRANAIKVLARILFEGLSVHKFYLADIAGGNLRNAIPREASATIMVKEKHLDATNERFRESAVNILEEIKAVDEGFVLELEECVKGRKRPKKVVPSAQTAKLINLLCALPHGVLAMSHDMPGLVETSCNLAVVGLDRKGLRVQMSSRSSIRSALQAMRDRIRIVAGMAGTKVEEPAAYPGWKPNLDSEVLKLTKVVFREITGKEPELKAIHAGLETGIIGERFPGMDMVSIGPDIKYPHSPDERINMPSVAAVFKVVARILEKV